MTSYTCGICGNIHSELPMDIAIMHPLDYFKVPDHELKRRVKFTEDLCSIDDKEYFIRGILELPVKDAHEGFRWGTWALVSEEDFNKYLKLWHADDVEDELPFVGWLAGGIPDYPHSDRLEVSVHLQSGNQRPRFQVVSDQHRLGIDQKQGITMENVHGFVERFMPSQLERRRRIFPRMPWQRSE